MDYGAHKMILATNQHLVTTQTDVTVAFVCAELAANEHIYVCQPAGFHLGHNFVLKHKWSDYSLKQAP